MRLFDGFYTGLRWILGGVFIYAGSIKLLEPKVFAVLIDAYGLVPDYLLMPVAIGLPALEVVAGLGLIPDIKGSLPAITVLLLMFIVILGYGIYMGLDVDCGCFGPDDAEAMAFHGLRTSLYRDLIMLTGIVFMVVWRRYRRIAPISLMDMFHKVASKRRTENAYG
jgi:uncharacterized membrane protein YphA (DoxX/SURF4 family)